MLESGFGWIMLGGGYVYEDEDKEDEIRGVD